jgi:hypothetical protein
MKCSCHSLIPFLPVFRNCRLNSVPLLTTSYPGRLASRSSTCHWTASTELFFLTTLHWPRRKPSLSIAGKACLQCRCIATEVTQLLLAYSLPRDVFTEFLPIIESLFWLRYSGFRASCHNIKKWCVTVWIGLIWLRIGTNGTMLRTLAIRAKASLPQESCYILFARRLKRKQN